MPVDRHRLRSLVEEARVARLATVRADGRVDVVPITFAFVGDLLVTAVDHKPKSTSELQRLDNIAIHPAVTVLVDHYDDEDWTQLWWVRLRGYGRVRRDGAEWTRAVDSLVARYPQYRDQRPEGPAIVIELTDWSGWVAAA